MEVNMELFEKLQDKLPRKRKGWCFMYVLEWEQKLYVGSAVDLFNRMKLWRGELIERDVWSARILEIIHLVTQAEADALETEMIARLNTVVPNGHNKNASGKGADAGGWKHSEASKAKIRASLAKYRESVSLKPWSNSRLAKPPKPPKPLELVTPKSVSPKPARVLLGFYEGCYQSKRQKQLAAVRAASAALQDVFVCRL